MIGGKAVVILFFVYAKTPMPYRKNQPIVYLDRSEVRKATVVSHDPQSDTYVIRFMVDGHTHERETVPERTIGNDAATIAVLRKKLEVQERKLNEVYDQAKFLTKYVEKLVKAQNRR
mgnify:CR=1 FL=1